MRQTRGFTLVELLVVVAIIAILASVLLPSLGRARELSRQSACKMSLNSVGRGFMQYEKNEGMRTDGKGAMPRFDSEGTPTMALPTTGTQTEDELWDVRDPTTGLQDPKLPNYEASMQQVWLLIAEKLATETMFSCPSDEAYTKRSGNTGRFGWTDASQTSYSLHWYSSKDTKFGLTTQLDDDFVIMGDQHPTSEPVYTATGTGLTAGAMRGVSADSAPGVSDGVTPANHRKDGFNVLTLNGRVRWHGQKNEDGFPENSFAGKEKDDVYTSNGPPPKGADTSAPEQGKSKFVDTYLVPNTE